ncbi:MAG: response regulator [Anaerolineae bacterium]|nr:response regulator [Anaerolineae bacterium]
MRGGNAAPRDESQEMGVAAVTGSNPQAGLNAGRLYRILVVEDERRLREQIVEALILSGYEPVQAEDGPAALISAATLPPDLILCDIRMPGMTGLEVLQQIRQTPGIADTPFIFVTAMAERHMMRSGMELGAEDYLTKPFTITELLDAVRIQLEKRERNAQAERERERARLARDLHDSVKQTLWSAMLLLEASENAAGSERGSRAVNPLLKVRTLIQIAVLEMQTLLMELRPEMLAMQGLPEALRQLTDTLRSTQSFNLGLTVRPILTLPDRVQVVFYRVAQEALSNAIRHASPRQVHVTLSGGRKAAMLEIVDDGVGFDPQSAAAGVHMGVAHMQERAAEVGANLVIESRHGHGTRVRIIWPVERR